MFVNGSEIVRVDFHLHSKADKEFKYLGDEENYITEYVDSLKSRNIKVGVITNHNKFDYNEYKKISGLARKQGILILPGAEIAIKEGSRATHILFVFNPKEWIRFQEDSISQAISSLFLGIHNPENENTHCNKDFITCLDFFEKLGKDFFVICAHVEQDSGLWKECRGAVISSLAKNQLFRKRVLGFQKVRTRDLKSVVENEWMGYSIASVEGSDPKCIDEIGKGKEVYLKIGALSYSAVKYALQDYRNRVFEEKPVLTHSYINKVEFVGGELDGLTYEPSPELNTLIGIRGSGKSSVLETIRYAMELKASTEDNKYKEELVKRVLGSGGKVILSVVDKYGRKYTISRIFDEAATVQNQVGETQQVSIQTLLNNPLYFGQKDLSLSKRGDEFELLDKLIGQADKESDYQFALTVSQLSSEIKKFIELEDNENHIEELVSEIKDIEHKLTIFAEKGIDEKLKKQISCNQDLVKLQGVYTTAKKASDTLKQSLDMIKAEEISLDDYTSEYNADIFSQAKQPIDNLSSTLEQIKENKKQFDQEIVLLDESIDSLKKRIDSLKEEFAQIKRSIDDDSLDLDSFVFYKKQLDEKSQELDRFKLLIRDKDTVKNKIIELLETRERIKTENFQFYNTWVKKINESQTPIQIEVIYKGNKKELAENLRQYLYGTRFPVAKCTDLANKYNDFDDIIRDYYINGGEKLRTDLPETAYIKMVDVLKKQYEELLKKKCPNEIRIKYHGKLLSSHSLGQRASALLLFVLNKGDSDVVIIDQPEDDLDSQVIYTELVKTIKEKKRDVQMIFATHNANIPVLGDAERVVTASYNEETKKILLNQSTIDDDNAHADIVSIMEGGGEAFTRRNEIYSSWNIKQ